MLRGVGYRIGFVAASGLFALLLVGSSIGAQYASDIHHYSIEVPSGWSQSSFPIAPSSGIQVDRLYQSPNFFVDFGFMATGTKDDSAAKDTPDYILSQAKAERDQVVAGTMGGGTVTITSEPQSKTYAGRPAAEFTFSISSTFGTTSVVLTLREIAFSSNYYKKDYFLLFMAKSEQFNGLEPTWTSVVNSFKVTGEPSPAPPSNPGLVIGIVAAVIVAAVLVALLVIMGRRRRMAAVPPTFPSQVQSTPEGPILAGQQPPRTSSEGVPEGTPPLPPPPPQDERD